MPLATPSIRSDGFVMLAASRNVVAIDNTAKYEVIFRLFPKNLLSQR